MIKPHSEDASKPALSEESAAQSAAGFKKKERKKPRIIELETASGPDQSTLPTGDSSLEKTVEEATHHLETAIAEHRQQSLSDALNSDPLIQAETRNIVAIMTQQIADLVKARSARRQEVELIKALNAGVFSRPVHDLERSQKEKILEWMDDTNVPVPASRELTTQDLKDLASKARVIADRRGWLHQSERMLDEQVHAHNEKDLQKVEKWTKELASSKAVIIDRDDALQKALDQDDDFENLVQAIAGIQDDFDTTYTEVDSEREVINLLEKQRGLFRTANKFSTEHQAVIRAFPKSAIHQKSLTTEQLSGRIISSTKAIEALKGIKQDLFDNVQRIREARNRILKAKESAIQKQAKDKKDLSSRFGAIRKDAPTSSSLQDLNRYTEDLKRLSETIDDQFSSDTAMKELKEEIQTFSKEVLDPRILQITAERDKNIADNLAWNRKTSHYDAQLAAFEEHDFLKEKVNKLREELRKSTVGSSQLSSVQPIVPVEERIRREIAQLSAAVALFDDRKKSEPVSVINNLLDNIDQAKATLKGELIRLNATKPSTSRDQSTKDVNARIGILGKLTEDLQAKKMEFITSSTTTLDQFITNCERCMQDDTSPKALMNLSQNNKPRFVRFLRTVLEPLHQLIKKVKGEEYRAHFFSDKSEEETARAAQNMHDALSALRSKVTQSTPEVTLGGDVAEDGEGSGERRMH